MSKSLEERIAALEAKIAELERRIAGMGMPQTYWPRQIRPYYIPSDTGSPYDPPYYITCGGSVGV